MALDSFRRDFGLDQVETTTRDTIQGNIVSTFQVRSYPAQAVPAHTLLTSQGWLLLGCSSHISHC
jgi:hypothetical protein